MLHIKDHILVAQLQKEDGASIELLYKQHFTAIARYITQNSGFSQDAEDIFQESILVLLNKIRQPDFVLTASLKTYLFSIAKNLWLKRLRDDRKISYLSAPYSYEEALAQEEVHDHGMEYKVHAWLMKITPHCQRILKALYYFDETIDTLMGQMGWKNKHTAANQKYKCLEQVKKQSLKEARS